MQQSQLCAAYCHLNQVAVDNRNETLSTLPRALVVISVFRPFLRAANHSLSHGWVRGLQVWDLKKSVYVVVLF
jgi:hypothetical protein